MCSNPRAKRGEQSSYDDPPKYQQYRKLGGIINENDYDSALLRAKSATTLDKTRTAQAEHVARFAGIELHNAGDVLDPITALYGILRADIRPEKVRHHHSQMCDQRLFAEALRMLGNVDALNKLIRAHPHISFVHEQRDVK